MPRVPQVDLPSVSLQAGMSPQFQAPQVTPMRDFTGQQIEQAGQGLAQLGAGALRLEDRINDSKASEADAELAEFQLAAWNDYKSNLGKNAIDNKKKYLEDMDKKRQEIASRLDNGFQQDAFARSANYRTLQFRENVERHFEDQSKAYFIGTREARIKANSSLYGESQDDVLFQTILADVDFIADELQYEPQDPRRAQMKLQAQDNAHLSRLGRLTDGPTKDLAAANQYFQSRKDGMSPELRGKIAEQLGKMSLHSDSEAIARGLQSVGPLAAQLQVLDELYDDGQTISVELLDKTRDRLVTFNAQRQAAKAAGIDETQRQLKQAIDQGRSQGLDLEQILQRDNQLRLNVEAFGQQTFARDYAANGAMKETEAGNILYEEVRGNIASLRGTPWVQLVTRYRTVMSDQQINDLYGRWASVNDGLPGMGVSRSNRRDADAMDASTWKDVIEQRLRVNLGLPTDRALDDKNDKDKLGQSWAMLNAAIPGIMSAKTPEALQQVDEFLRKQGNEEAVLFQGKKMAPWRLTPLEQLQSEIQVNVGGNIKTLRVADFASEGPARAAAMKAAQDALKIATDSLPTQEDRQQFLQSEQGVALQAAAEGRNVPLMVRLYGGAIVATGQQVVRDANQQQARYQLAERFVGMSVTDDELRAITQFVDPNGEADAADLAQALHMQNLWNIPESEWSKEEVRRAAVARIQNAQRPIAVSAGVGAPGFFVRGGDAKSAERAIQQIGKRRGDVVRKQQMAADFQAYVASNPMAQKLSNEQAVMSFVISKMTVVRNGRPTLDAGSTEVISDLTPLAEMILNPYRQVAENVRTQSAIDMAEAVRKRASEQARQMLNTLPLLTGPAKK